MAGAELTEQDWQIRLFVYQFFIDHERPPTHAEAAKKFDLTATEGRDAYQRLNTAHALFLDPGTDNIRMAHPLSAVPTPYQVQVGDKNYYANCAWDSLGIPAMLHADAKITARYAHSDEPITYSVQNGEVIPPAEGIVHFALPFAQWYDNLIHT